MESEDRQAVVLARMPDLTALGESVAASSGGRLLNQAVSFRLIGGTVVLLLAAAISPFLIGGGHRDKTPVDDGQPQMPVAASDAVPHSASPTAKAPAPVIVKPSPVAETAPCTAAVPASPSPVATAAEPLMTPWPNPANATSLATAPRNDEPPADANRATAIRTQYTGNQQ